MSAVLSAAGQLQSVPMAQTVQPTSMDQSRNVERQEFEPKEDQIQAQSAPSAQTQTSNESKDATVSLDAKELAKFLSDLQRMSADDKELPNRGSVLDIET